MLFPSCVFCEYYSIHNILPFTVLPGAEEVKIEFRRLHRIYRQNLVGCMMYLVEPDKGLYNRMEDVRGLRKKES
jgi:hypothetical protein